MHHNCIVKTDELMIKKLDRLILKSFIGPFIITFFIAFFVLMMQTLWKYIDDFVGKGLDFLTLAKFLWYASASMLTLAMPIAILISSIMTFGNLGESFELVAIKASGISLLRFMRPLVYVNILLCGITFLFANYVIPYSTLKFVTIYNDIRYKKPALDLKEGVFFTYIPNYAIKVGKKESDGKHIKNVLLYDQTNNLQDNSVVAEKGVMQISKDKQFLEFNLQNGASYQEKGELNDTTTEYIRLEFEEYKVLFDLSALQMQNNSDSFYRKNYKMLSVNQLSKSLDSLNKISDSLNKKIDKSLSSSVVFNISDSLLAKPPILPNHKKYKNFDTLIIDSLKTTVFERALSIAEGLKNNLEFDGKDLESRDSDIRFHQIEWHRKFSLSMACLVLFFIGAPLGSIIRKGGLGMPLVVAIIFFLIFHLLNTFGEKYVKQDIVPPYFGMWLAVIALIPVGFFFTYKAMHDSQLFNKEFYTRAIKKIGAWITLKKLK
jgi:lipopolysaccharide export system permease protein